MAIRDEPSDRMSPGRYGSESPRPLDRAPRLAQGWRCCPDGYGTPVQAEGFRSGSGSRAFRYPDDAPIAPASAITEESRPFRSPPHRWLSGEPPCRSSTGDVEPNP